MKHFNFRNYNLSPAYRTARYNPELIPIIHNYWRYLTIGILGLAILWFFASGQLFIRSAWAQDANVEMKVEDDLTVLGIEGTDADPDLEVRGFSAFGDSPASTHGLSGQGSVVIGGAAEVDGTAYFDNALSVSAAGNIYLSNGVASQITSNAALSIISGSAGDVDLTLQGQGAGTVYVDDNLEVAGTTIFNTVEYAWPASIAGKNNYALTVNETTGQLSWTDVGAGVVGGSGNQYEVAVWGGTSTLTSDADFVWGDAGGDYLGIRTGKEWRLYDVDNSNYTGFKAPALTSNFLYTLPDATGVSTDYVLTWQTGNNLQWKSATGAGAGDITKVGSMESGDAFADTNASGQWLGLGSSGYGRIEFEDAATDEVNILEAHVGIGISTPGAGLDVQKDLTASGGAAMGVNFEQTLTATANNDVLTALNIKPTFDDGIYTGIDHYGLIVEDGNVGIGTTNPGQLLTVGGTLGILEGGASPTHYTIFQGGDEQSTDITYFLPTAIAAANNYVLTSTTGGVLEWKSVTGAGGGTMNDFTLSDGTNTQLIEDGNTLTVAAGTAINTLVEATDKVTISVGGDSIDGDQLADAIDLDDDLNIESDTLFIGKAGGSYAGLVGIGTATPGVKLDIRQSADSVGMEIYGYDDHSTDSIQLYIDSAGQANVESNGAFQIISGGGLSTYIYDDYAHFFGTLSINDDEVISLGDGDYAMGYNLADDTLRIADGSDLTTTPRIVLDSSGNVGIGTTNPNYKLDIQDSQAVVQVKATTGTDGAYSRYVNNNTFLLGVENSTGGLLATGTEPYAGVLNIPNAYPLQFGTNNAVRMTILSGGNVGIGTTNPTSKLYIQGGVVIDNSGSGSLRIGSVSQDRIISIYPQWTTSIFSPSSSHWNGVLTTNEAWMPLISGRNFGINANQAAWPAFIVEGAASIADDYMQVRSDGATEGDILTINSSGNVGVGTTDPSGKLTVSTTTEAPTLNIYSAQTQPDLGHLDFDANNQNTERKTIASIRNIYDNSATGNESGDLAFYTIYAGTLDERVRINSNGNVGIGITNPGGLLGLQDANTYIDVDGSNNLIFTDAVSGTRTLAELTSGAGSEPDRIYEDNSEVEVVDATDGYIEFIEDATEVMRITGGNVGIGTTNPSAKLDVIGDTEISNNLVVGTDLDIGGKVYDSGGAQLMLGEAGDTIYMTGNIGAGTDTPQNQLDVEGAAVIGASYSGTETAPANGLLVQGNVGIGTTNPEAGYLLDVEGPVIFQNSTDSTNAFMIRTAAAPSDELFWVDTTNETVSIGETASTISKLGVLQYDAGSTMNALHATSWGTGDILLLADTGNVVFEVLDEGHVKSRNWTNSTTAWQVQNASGTTVFDIDTTNSRVGIGTTNPGAELDVNGSLVISDTAGTIAFAGATYDALDMNNSAIFDVDNIRFYDVGVGEGLSWGNDKISIYSAAQGGYEAMVFETETAPARNFVFNNGNVGVGITSPDEKLHVDGNLKYTGTVRSGAAGEPGRWRFYDSSGYLMSFWVPGTDYDTWGLNWETTENEMQWIGAGTLASSIDLDDGNAYFRSNVGIGTTNPGGLLGLQDANTYIDVDGSNNLIFTDAVSGTRTLAELTSGAGSEPDRIYEDNSEVEVVDATDGYIEFIEDATEVMRITGGNVGIGETSPHQKLDVRGTIEFGDTHNDHGLLSADGSYTYLKSYDNTIRIQTERDVDDIIFGTGDTVTDRLIIEGDSGNVGIGTTNPGDKLTVFSPTDHQGITVVGESIADSPGLSLLRYDDTPTVDDLLSSISFGGSTDHADAHTFARISSYVDGDVSGTSDIPGRLVFSTVQDGSAALSERMTIDNQGNVGIGITNPGGLLGLQDANTYIDVDGSNNLIFTDAVSGTRTLAELTSGAGSEPDRIYEDNSEVEVVDATDGYIEFIEDATEVMRITGGNVGIGITNPSNKLDVYDSSAGLYAANILNNDGNGLGLQVAAGDGGEYILHLKSFDGSPRHSFRADGDVWLSQGVGEVGIGITTPANAKLTVVQSAAEDIVNIFDDTTEVFTILDGGNVGIGTTDPQSMLSVGLSPTDNAFIGVHDYGASGYTWLMNLQQSTVTYGDRSAFSVRDDGRVGLGTTDPSTNLHIFEDSAGEGSALYLQSWNATDWAEAALWLHTPQDFWSMFLDDDTNDELPSGNLGFLSGNYGGIVMVLDDDGDVGIGTTNPDYPLHLYRAAGSNPTFVMSDGDVAHGITALAGTSDVLLVEMLDNTAGGTLMTSLSDADSSPFELWSVYGSADPTDSVPAITLRGAKKSGTNVQALANTETVLQVANDTSNLMTILGNGNVGIGTTNPTYGLDVVPANSVYGIRVRSTGDIFTVGNADFVWAPSASGLQDRVKFGNNTTSSSAGSTFFTINPSSGNTGDIFKVMKANTPYLTVDTSGYVGFGTTGPDRRVDSFDDTNPQLRLTHTDGTIYGELQVDGSGNLTVTTTGSSVAFSGDNVAATTFTEGGTLLSDKYELKGGGPKTIRFFPEYEGALIVADGSDNIGEMTSDMEVYGNYRYNYYEWSAAPANLQDYDIYLKWQVPSNFTGFQVGDYDALIVDIATSTSNASDSKVDVYLYEDGSGAAETKDENNVSSSPTAWMTDQEDSAVVLFDESDATLSNLDAGDVLVIRIVMTCRNNNYARVGAITMNLN